MRYIYKTPTVLFKKLRGVLAFAQCKTLHTDKNPKLLMCGWVHQ